MHQVKKNLGVHQAQILLDVNTKEAKVGINLALVMIGRTCVFDAGDSLKEDEAANYSLNLDKVLSSSGS